MNKILSIVLITLLLVVSLALVSCGEPKICTEHDFVDTVVASTCTAKGYTEHICSICGYSYKDSYTDTHIRKTTVVKGNCTEEGYTLIECPTKDGGCGWAIRTNITSIVENNHSFPEELKVTVKPLCNEFGYTIYECEHCHIQQIGDYEYPRSEEHENWSDWGLLSPDGVVCGDSAIERRVCGDCGTIEERIVEYGTHFLENVSLDLATGELKHYCDCGLNKVEYPYDYKNVLEYELVGEGDAKHYVVKGFKAGTSAEDKKEVYIPHSILDPETGKAIPVAEIANAAFINEDAIESLVLSATVTKIDASAFSYCSNLKSITFDGTINDWTNMNKVYTWNYKSGVYTVTCTDGTVDK